jgi:hypothetical protein
MAPVHVFKASNQNSNFFSSEKITEVEDVNRLSTKQNSESNFGLTGYKIYISHQFQSFPLINLTSSIKI